jgi:acetoin utilization deacetylase AcuC-like enzyme
MFAVFRLNNTKGWWTLVEHHHRGNYRVNPFTPVLPVCAHVYAGVDIHEADKLGRLCISDAGLARRDACVLDACLAHGIPVAGMCTLVHCPALYRV